MRLKDEFEVRECYEVEPGCPTLTVVWLSKETMIPWNQFSQGEFTPGEIVLTFGPSFTVKISGEDLEEIWKASQMQDLRSVRASQETDNGKCRVLTLDIEVPHDEDDEDEDEIPF
ncbi:hypothetical protein N9062_01735 [Akkermansiaceae bacterium]|jgi:hypothetical protein|nr:hypothetical protein [Akkermansiaceae bacterium]MDA7907299.1 hypothetical protein [Akkermansiaceae bacterium]MDB4465203.1 hypothetical protein [Akkermansiaceae bacterium]MDB4509703.1 hypothetical protein [Akkermansiaceae bacterium]